MDPLANTSFANIRFIRQRTAASEAECRNALCDATGDVMAALSYLGGPETDAKYMDHYYPGPFEPVSDPDKDLPRRTNQLLGSHERDLEANRQINGERFIAPFNDANSLEEIYGDLWLAMGYPNDWDDDERNVYPTIQGCLAEIADRIREKLTRNKNAVCAKHFTQALINIEHAKDAYFDGDYSRGVTLLHSCEESLRSGNRSRK